MASILSWGRVLQVVDQNVIYLHFQPHDPVGSGNAFGADEVGSRHSAGIEDHTVDISVLVSQSYVLAVATPSGVSAEEDGQVSGVGVLAEVVVELSEVVALVHFHDVCAQSQVVESAQSVHSVVNPMVAVFTINAIADGYTVFRLSAFA